MNLQPKTCPPGETVLKAVVLKLQHASASPEEIVKTKFLKSSQEVQRQLVQGAHLEDHHLRSSLGEGLWKQKNPII